MTQLRPIPKTQTLGADLRVLRKSRGLTLQSVADHVNCSVGWLSQVERDMSDVSVEVLRDIAALYDVSVSSLFMTQAVPEEDGHIVRGNLRRPIGSREAGLVEELLSPDLTDDFEVVHSTFEPGAQIETAVTRPTQEVGYIVSGQLDLWIGEKKFALSAGDSFRIRGEPYRWANAQPEPCIAIWIIAPPVY